MPSTWPSSLPSTSTSTIGKAIIVVVLPRHKPHRHCHYSAAFAITPLLAWMSVCGLRRARSDSTPCRLALAGENLNLILTFIMHTQEAHIFVPLPLFLFLCDNKLPVRFDFISVLLRLPLLVIIKLLDLFRFIFGFDLLSQMMKNVCSWLTGSWQLSNWHKSNKSESIKREWALFICIL